MLIEIGHVEAIFRYPVKSMGGERLEVAELGWYGLEGDRRLAFRRIDDRSGMPWLTASKLPDLLLFAPHGRQDGAQGDLPTHVRTPLYVVKLILIFLRIAATYHIAKKLWGSLAMYWRVPARQSGSSKQEVDNCLLFEIFTELNRSVPWKSISPIG